MSAFEKTTTETAEDDGNNPTKEEIRNSGARFPVTDVAIPTDLPYSVTIQRRMLELSKDEEIGCGGLVDEGGSSESSSLGVNILDGGHKHGFIAAVTRAFANHYPLSLRPQHIWLMILQAVATHVDLNAEQLRSRWVPHEGKKTLSVSRDGFVQGQANDWAGVVPDFTSQIDANLVSGLAGVLSAPFSGTTAVEDVAMKITVMDVCKNFFEYKVSTRCGFPYINLEGSEEDWIALRRHAEELIQERCLESFASFWLPALLPLLDKFVEQYRIGSSCGSIDTVDGKFWNSMCKLGGCGGSGAYTWFNGWFNILFPYINSSGEWYENRYCVSYSQDRDYVKEGLVYGERYDCFRGGIFPSGPDIENFPNGLAKAPVEWNFLGEKINLNFVAGFVGASQDPVTKVISPHIGWFVAKRVEQTKKRRYPWDE